VAFIGPGHLLLMVAFDDDAISPHRRSTTTTGGDLPDHDARARALLKPPAAAAAAACLLSLAAARVVVGSVDRSVELWLCGWLANATRHVLLLLLLPGRAVWWWGFIYIAPIERGVCARPAMTAQTTTEVAASATTRDVFGLSPFFFQILCCMHACPSPSPSTS
jgi:hypothetical protein